MGGWSEGSPSKSSDVGFLTYLPPPPPAPTDECFVVFVCGSRCLESCCLCCLSMGNTLSGSSSGSDDYDTHGTSGSDTASDMASYTSAASAKGQLKHHHRRSGSNSSTGSRIGAGLDSYSPSRKTLAMANPNSPTRKSEHTARASLHPPSPGSHQQQFPIDSHSGDPAAPSAAAAAGGREEMYGSPQRHTITMQNSPGYTTNPSSSPRKSTAARYSYRPDALTGTSSSSSNPRRAYSLAPTSDPGAQGFAAPNPRITFTFDGPGSGAPVLVTPVPPPGIAADRRTSTMAAVGRQASAVGAALRVSRKSAAAPTRMSYTSPGGYPGYTGDPAAAGDGSGANNSYGGQWRDTQQATSAAADISGSGVDRDETYRGRSSQRVSRGSRLGGYQDVSPSGGFSGEGGGAGEQGFCNNSSAGNSRTGSGTLPAPPPPPQSAAAGGGGGERRGAHGAVSAPGGGGKRANRAKLQRTLTDRHLSMTGAETLEEAYPELQPRKLSTHGSQQQLQLIQQQQQQAGFSGAGLEGDGDGSTAWSDQGYVKPQPVFRHSSKPGLIRPKHTPSKVFDLQDLNESYTNIKDADEGYDPWAKFQALSDKADEAALALDLLDVEDDSASEASSASPWGMALPAEPQASSTRGTRHSKASPVSPAGGRGNREGLLEEGGPRGKAAGKSAGFDAWDEAPAPAAAAVTVGGRGGGGGGKKGGTGFDMWDAAPATTDTAATGSLNKKQPLLLQPLSLPRWKQQPTSVSAFATAPEGNAAAAAAGGGSGGAGGGGGVGSLPHKAPKKSVRSGSGRSVAATATAAAAEAVAAGRMSAAGAAAGAWRPSGTSSGTSSNTTSNNSSLQGRNDNELGGPMTPTPVAAAAATASEQEGKLQLQLLQLQQQQQAQQLQQLQQRLQQQEVEHSLTLQRQQQQQQEMLLNAKQAELEEEQQQLAVQAQQLQVKEDHIIQLQHQQQQDQRMSLAVGLNDRGVQNPGWGSTANPTSQNVLSMSSGGNGRASRATPAMDNIMQQMGPLAASAVQTVRHSLSRSHSLNRDKGSAASSTGMSSFDNNSSISTQGGSILSGGWAQLGPTAAAAGRGGSGVGGGMEPLLGVMGTRSSAVGLMTGSNKVQNLLKQFESRQGGTSTPPAAAAAARVGRAGAAVTAAPGVVPMGEPATTAAAAWEGGGMGSSVSPAAGAASGGVYAHSAFNSSSGSPGGNRLSLGSGSSGLTPAAATLPVPPWPVSLQQLQQQIAGGGVGADEGAAARAQGFEFNSGSGQLDQPFYRASIMQQYHHQQQQQQQGQQQQQQQSYHHHEQQQRELSQEQCQQYYEQQQQQQQQQELQQQMQPQHQQQLLLQQLLFEEQSMIKSHPARTSDNFTSPAYQPQPPPHQTGVLTAGSVGPPGSPRPPPPPPPLPPHSPTAALSAPPTNWTEQSTAGTNRDTLLLQGPRATTLLHQSQLNSLNPSSGTSYTGESSSYNASSYGNATGMVRSGGSSSSGGGGSGVASVLQASAHVGDGMPAGSDATAAAVQGPASRQDLLAAIRHGGIQLQHVHRPSSITPSF